MLASNNDQAMKKLLLLALLVGTTSQLSWSAQKPLEITCDYYTHKIEMYENDSLYDVVTYHGNKQEGDSTSSQDYWIDLANRKAHSSNFHQLDNVIQKGETLILNGEEKLVNSTSGKTMVVTVEIKLNLKTMTGEESQVDDGSWLNSDMDTSRTHYYSLDGECRYEYNGLNFRKLSE